MLDGDAVDALAAARCWRLWRTVPLPGDPERARAADDLTWLAGYGWRLVRVGDPVAGDADLFPGDRVNVSRCDCCGSVRHG